MERRKTIILAGTLAAAVIAGGAGIGFAASDGDDDQPLTGSTLEKATAAALEATGGGTVVETEVGDDGAAYEVEIQLDDGTQVEVGLDDGFEVIGQETDDDGPGDDD